MPAPSSTVSRILVVDDDPKYRTIVESGLNECGFAARGAANPIEARSLLAAEPFDIVLLDIMMPRMDGWQFLESMRADGITTPVMFVSARESVEERVRGLKLGADDYIVKPFAFAELVARIEAVLRRAEARQTLECRGVRLDPIERSATVDGNRLNLSPLEFDVLRVLIQRKDRTVSRSELLREAWHMKHDPGTNVVEVHIARIRRKLGDRLAPMIETVRGEGYRAVDAERPR